MPIVILARHGRTAANASGVLAGRSPGVTLDDAGREQARAAAQRVSEVPLVEVVSSPLERCRETAKLMSAGLGVRVRTDKRLVECDYGEWTGHKLKDLARKPLWRTVQAQASAARFPGGESLPEMSARAVSAVRGRDAAIADAHGDAAVWLAVTHGDIVKAILADALGMHLDEFQRIVVDPASLSVIRYTPHRTFVLAMNTTSGSLGHLRPTARRRRSARSGVPQDDAVVGGGAGTTPEAS